MPPKGHRTSGSGQLRAHSRNSSAAKLGANLQLTQKDPQARKGYAHLTHTLTGTHEGHTRPGIARTNSAIRTASKDQVAPPPRRNASEVKLPPQRTTGGSNKPKVGFTINHDDDDDQDDDEDDDDDDDDAWISTESGAVTPSGHESESEESDAGTQARTPVVSSKAKPPPLSLAIDTATTKVTNGFHVPDTNTNTNTSTHVTVTNNVQEAAQPPPKIQKPDVPATVAPPSPSPSLPTASSSRRPSRPTSLLSDHHHSQPLRPHPLIRGNSYGQPNYTVTKPSPLAPLTVISEPPQNPPHTHTHTNDDNPISTSPSSLKTDTASPSSPRPHTSTSSYRRSSVSSARSVATLPAPTASATFSHPWTPLTLSHSHSRSSDRQRTLSTLSTLSTSSSSAAISSLAQIPAITRPTTPQKVAFFPRVNPYQDPEKRHPLLPPLYLQPHMTVLAKRNPLRESYERVVAAKNAN